MLTKLARQSIVDPTAKAGDSAPMMVLERLATSSDSPFEGHTLALVRLLTLQFPQHTGVQLPSDLQSLVFVALGRVVAEDVRALATITIEEPMPTIIPDCARKHGKLSFPASCVSLVLSRVLFVCALSYSYQL